MVLFLLNIVFLALTTLSALISQIIFTVAASLLVLLIQAFKVPGEAAKGALEQLADLIKSCVEYLMEFAFEVVSNLISAIFDLVKEGISGSATATGSAIGGLVELTRNSLEELVTKDLPAVFEGMSEMVSTIVADLWNNCQQAVAYVMENA